MSHGWRHSPVDALLAFCLALSVLPLAPAGVGAEVSYPWSTPLVAPGPGRFDLADYEGRTLLLSFFFTQCRTACPLQAQRLAKLQQRLDRTVLERTAFLSVSLDPVSDTDAAMVTFAATHGIDTSHWRLARTQAPEDLQQLMEQVNMIVRDAAPPGGQIDHRMTLLLLDARGGVAQRYLGDRFDVDRLERELITLVRLHDEGRLPERRGPMQHPGVAPQRLPESVITPHRHNTDESR